jgi:hypothetical protein
MLYIYKIIDCITLWSYFCYKKSFYHARIWPTSVSLWWTSQGMKTPQPFTCIFIFTSKVNWMADVSVVLQQEDVVALPCLATISACRDRYLKDIDTIKSRCTEAVNNITLCKISYPLSCELKELVTEEGSRLHLWHLISEQDLWWDWVEIIGVLTVLNLDYCWVWVKIFRGVWIQKKNRGYQLYDAEKDPKKMWGGMLGVALVGTEQ